MTDHPCDVADDLPPPSDAWQRDHPGWESVEKAPEPSPTILDPRDPISAARRILELRFSDKAGQRTLHRHRGAFWLFHRTGYRQLEDEEVRAAAWTFLESALREQSGALVPFKPNRAKVGDIVEALGAVCNLPSHIQPPAWLDQDADLALAYEFFACGNGLLHVPTGELFPPAASYFGLSASEVEYDPDAPIPTQWLAFLNAIFGDDYQAQETLQEWFGYCLTLDTSQQKILLVIGPTRSGKGTIGRVLTGLLGRDSVVGPTLAALSTNFGLEPLIGRSVAVISDARLGSRSDHAAIAERLLSISGEDSLTVDRKFRNAWTGRHSTRFVLLTNELPRLTDSSGALARRFIVLALSNSFYGREDPGLTNRLLTELPGILNWAQVGYERLHQRGYFLQPDSSAEAIEDLESLSSPVKAFVRERCVLAPDHSTSPGMLYDAWREWCVANGRREPGTVQSFGRDLRAACPTIHIVRPRSDTVGRYRVYQGITLRA